MIGDNDGSMLVAALDELERTTSDLAEVVARLGLASEVPRLEVDRGVEALLTAGRRFREVLHGSARRLGEAVPSWTDQDALRAAVSDVAQRLAEYVQRREQQRVDALARELREARVSHRVEARRRRLELLRSAAVAAFDGELDQVGTLPWPDDDEPSWMLWVLGLEDPTATRVLEDVRRVLPALAELLECLEAVHWTYSVGAPSPTGVEPVVWPSASVESAGGVTLGSSLAGEVMQEPADSRALEDAASRVPVQVDGADVTRESEPVQSEPLPVDGGTAATWEAESEPTEDAPRELESEPTNDEVTESSHEARASSLEVPTREAEEHVLPMPPLPVLPMQTISDCVPRTVEATEAPAASVAASEKLGPRATEPSVVGSSATVEAASINECGGLDPVAARTVESRGSEPADGLATTFPEALRSLQNFRMSYWRDGNGELVAAPWAAPEFPARLADAAAVALRRMDFTSLVIFGRCAHERMIDSLPTPEDLHALLALRAKPDRFVPDGGDMRVQAILEAVGDGERCATLRHQVMVLLVALGAAPERAVPPTSIEPMMEAVGLADTPVGAFLAAALRLGLEADNPLGRLRAELRRTPKRTSAELEQDLLAAEDELRSTFKHLYSAAGGKVQRTHCRGAWDEFLLKARPVIDGVLAATHDDIREIDGLIVLHDKIADRAGAKYLDRGVMNRAARQLVDVTRKVVAARREQARQQREQPMSAVANLIAAYRALDGAAGFGAAFVPLLHDLVVAPADAPEASVRSMLEKSDFLRIPALLETVPVVATDTVPIAVDPWTLADPVSAAVHLLLVDRSDFASPPDQDILALLRERKREDLLVHVTPVSKADAARAQQALKQARMDQYQALSAAEKQVRRMREVAHPWAPAVAEAVQEALKVAETTGVDGVKPEMLTTWMLRVTNYANDAVAQSIERMSEQFARQSPSPTEERQEHFQRAIQCGRLAAARALANGENLPNDESERATMWRREAVQTLVDPRRTLSRHTGEPALLIQAWLTGLRDEARDVELRRLFAGFVFAGELTPVENEKHRAVSIKNTRLREWLADAHLNPAFVPQLTAFKEIAVITAPVPPTVDSFVRQTAEAVAHAGDKRITVVLTPGITRQVRDALREDLRRRSARGYAILDDIDFARLVNPGGQQPNAVLGLLEIVLEQQPRWSPVQPFEPHEGQHTKPEMFVGREDEASRLATRAQYSRLFSGRKLGKSALLKHIRDTQQNTKLPSGNKLRVLYVPVVGLDGEAQVVDKIARCFAEELKHTPPSPPSDPQERLKHLVATYFERKQNDSVLVFLDEADMFVEAQIRDYEVRRERCLTWLMRTDLEARRDAMDLPRIRFVFAGYRATHRNEAAWANWGDVLRLEPLGIDAATRLISGPLARLGINASEEAATIAFLCGYQPAVIMQFGKRLIEHLDTTTPPARREAVVVKPEDVEVAFQSSDVQNELRTIVWNNFIGNRFGRVVFAAMLLEFSRLAPAVPLDDAPARILQRLREIVPGILAEHSLEGSLGERIDRELREFVERSLLQLVDAATQSYVLRFPHHLSSLLQDDQEASIRREAAELDAGAGAEPLQDVRTLLPRVSLLDLGEALTLEGVDAVVAASHWTPGLAVGAASVPDRLGLDTDDVFDTLVSLDDESGRFIRPSLGIFNATPETAERVLAVREGLSGVHPPLFVGGLDLLRWAIRTGQRRHIELASASRLSIVQLRWWFERIRAIEFAGPSPAREFLTRTSGIPFLVGLIDRELEHVVGFGGNGATEGQVRGVIASYESQFQRQAAELLGGNSGVALLPREADLLAMVQCASAAVTRGADLREMLVTADEWPEVFPWAKQRKLALRSGDEVHIELLLRAGLLPAALDAAAPWSPAALTLLEPGDAGYRLAEAVARCLSK